MSVDSILDDFIEKSTNDKGNRVINQSGIFSLDTESSWTSSNHPKGLQYKIMRY